MKTQKLTVQHPHITVVKHIVQSEKAGINLSTKNALVGMFTTFIVNLLENKVVDVVNDSLFSETLLTNCDEAFSLQEELIKKGYSIYEYKKGMCFPNTEDIKQFTKLVAVQMLYYKHGSDPMTLKEIEDFEQDSSVWYHFKLKDCCNEISQADKLIDDPFIREDQIKNLFYCPVVRLVSPVIGGVVFTDDGILPYSDEFKWSLFTE